MEKLTCDIMNKSRGCFIILCIAASLIENGQSWTSFTPPLPRPLTLKNRSTLSMKIKVGLVGLPNVGKSTLFNAIAQKSIAEAKNFPFCTIEPNITPIPIPDATLEKLATLAKSKRAIPATISFVDVAGLVKGASRGEGLGNRFLATVRECDLIVHVVRNYVDGDIVHVHGAVDPVGDAEVVNLELILADQSHVHRRLERSSCTGEERDVLAKVEKALESGLPARTIGLSSEEKLAIKSMGLLTLKPVIYAFNVDEVDFLLNRGEAALSAARYTEQIQYTDSGTDSYLVVSAKLESEMSSFSEEERTEYLESMGVEPSGADYSDELSYRALPRCIEAVLNLSLVYTGPGVAPERSQTTKTHILSSNRMTALELAGKLHGDIKKGFMHAEVTRANSLVQYSNYNEAKENGLTTMESRNYILRSGDVVLIKWKQ